LTAVTKGGTAWGIEILHEGSKFGIGRVPGEKDQVLWMGLVQLGLRLGETYAVLPSVTDPEMLPNAPRSVN
jgi:hypothetical protein